MNTEDAFLKYAQSLEEAEKKRNGEEDGHVPAPGFGGLAGQEG